MSWVEGLNLAHSSLLGALKMPVQGPSPGVLLQLVWMQLIWVLLVWVLLVWVQLVWVQQLIWAQLV